MDLSFGARLRAQRERQAVALSAISERTKIRLSLLEELEQDNVSHWPSGIFRRSYLRTYAQAIGLDPEPTVREFLDLYPDPLEEPTTAALLAAQTGTTVETIGQRPNSRLHYMIGSAMSALPQLLRSGPREAPSGFAVREAPSHSAKVVERDGDSWAPVPPPTRAPSQANEPAPFQPIGQLFHPDLMAMAHLCRQFAQVQVASDVTPLLADAAGILGAEGIIVWVWDVVHSVLRHSVSHGYPADLLSQLPSVRADSNIAIAAAFRSGDVCVVEGGNGATGAVVVPMLTPTGCAGVLAIELRDGLERRDAVQALATILTAQLSTLVKAPPVPVVHSATA